MKVVENRKYHVFYPTGYSDVISGHDLMGKYNWIYQLIEVGYARAIIVKEKK